MEINVNKQKTTYVNEKSKKVEKSQQVNMKSKKMKGGKD